MIAKKPFDSLNCNLNSSDDKIHVKANINVTKQKLGLKQTRIKFVSQIHGTHIELIDHNNITKEIINFKVQTKLTLQTIIVSLYMIIYL